MPTPPRTRKTDKESEAGDGRRVGGQGDADAGEDEQSAGEDQQPLAAETIAQSAGQERPDQAADRGGACRPALLEGTAEMKILFIERLRAVDDHPVVAEQQPPQGRRERDRPDVPKAIFRWVCMFIIADCRPERGGLQDGRGDVPLAPGRAIGSRPMCATAGLSSSAQPPQVATLLDERAAAHGEMKTPRDALAPGLPCCRATRPWAPRGGHKFANRSRSLTGRRPAECSAPADRAQTPSARRRPGRDTPPDTPHSTDAARPPAHNRHTSGPAHSTPPSARRIVRRLRRVIRDRRDRARHHRRWIIAPLGHRRGRGQENDSCCEKCCFHHGSFLEKRVSARFRGPQGRLAARPRCI